MTLCLSFKKRICSSFEKCLRRIAGGKVANHAALSALIVVELEVLGL